MRGKHIHHIHALYLGSLILAFVLGGVVSGFISIPNFSNAAGGNLTIGGGLAVKGVATFGVAGAGTPFSATGGTITQSGGYTIHTLTSSGTFTPNGAQNVEVLVVGGGGGGGGYIGGGGGGGGVRYAASFPVIAQNYAVTVGAGGSGGISTGDGTKGNDSSFSTIIAAGGGRGACGEFCSGNGDGGSGGGQGRTWQGRGGVAGVGNTPVAVPSQGNNGGAGSVSGGSDNAGSGAGGGGGGSMGGNAVVSVAGSGGDGFLSSISGVAVRYGAGGGGGAYNGTGGAGGAGGGGVGANGSGSVAGAGTPNTGSGGGAGGYPTNQNGGNGGSGIVIIRYPTPNNGVVKIEGGRIFGDGGGLSNLPAQQQQLPAGPQVYTGQVVNYGGGVYAAKAACPSGTMLTGGGCAGSQAVSQNYVSYPQANGWTCEARASGIVNTAYALCLPAQ